MLLKRNNFQIPSIGDRMEEQTSEESDVVIFFEKFAAKIIVFSGCPRQSETSAIVQRNVQGR